MLLYLTVNPILSLVIISSLLLLVIVSIIAFYRAFRDGFFKTKKFLFILVSIVWFIVVFYSYDRLPESLRNLPAIIGGGSLVLLWHFWFRPYNKGNAAYYQGYGLGLLGRLFVKKEDLTTTNKTKDMNSWSALDRFAFKHHALFFWTGTSIFTISIGLYVYFYLIFNASVWWGVLIFIIFIPLIFKFIKILFRIEG